MIISKTSLFSVHGEIRVNIFEDDRKYEGNGDIKTTSGKTWDGQYLDPSNIEHMWQDKATNIKTYKSFSPKIMYHVYFHISP